MDVIELVDVCEQDGCEEPSAVTFLSVPHPPHVFGSSTSVCQIHAYLAASSIVRAYLVGNGIDEPKTDEDRQLVKHISEHFFPQPGPVH